ncbi:MAG: 1-deoxy-D-xylulose-5-phosphate synthase N-terminal domain-containing protein [Chloroflexota bacterium]
MNNNSQASWQEEAQRVAFGIRKQVLELTIERNGCYLSQALSSAEILATLYTKVMNLGPSIAPMLPPPYEGVPGPDIPAGSGGLYHGEHAPHLDRFLISPAHYAVAIYAALVEVGRMDRAGLKQFNIDGYSVEMIGAEHSPGFELTTGSFGQAVSQAGGIAMGRRLKGHTGRTFVFMSDGELEEGQTWEAVQALAFYKMDSVIVYVDVNGQQVDGLTKDIMNIEPINSRLLGFGATVSVVDGHDVDALAKAADEGEPGKPHFVLCYTDTAKGIPLLEERKPKLHYVRFKDEAEMAIYQKFLDEMSFETMEVA